MMISAHITTICLAILFTVGCQGNNPFDRDSDPVKDYPSFEDDQAIPSEIPEKPEIDLADFKAPSQAFKERSFLINVVGQEADQPMQFIRGMKESYDIEVINKVDGTLFSLQMAKNLDGTDINDCSSGLPCLRPVDAEGDTQKWELSWNPSLSYDFQKRSPRQSIQVEFVVEDESSDLAKTRHIDNTLKKLTLDLDYSAEEPVINSIAGLDGESPTYTEGGANPTVTVRVDDPNAFDKRRPEVFFPSSKSGASNQNDFPAGGLFSPLSASYKKEGDFWVGKYEILIGTLAEAYRKSGGKESEFTATVDIRPFSTASERKGPKVTRSFTVKLKPEPKAQEPKEGSGQ